MSSNPNQYPVNIGNMNLPQNSLNQMNQLNQMNLVFLNNNIANLNLQNNIQMNQNYYLSKLNLSMESYDLMTFQAIITELVEHQPQMYLNQIKNTLLNKAILLYLSLYNQGTSQYAIKQMITLLLIKLKANPNLRLRYINNPNHYNININNNYYGNSAIFPIVEKNDIELVKVFLDNNLDIQVKDSIGRNSLFYLMTTPNSKDNFIDRKPLCSLLLGKQIKINYTDDTGISPMMEAINKGYNYIMNMLIKYNGDANIVNPNDGNTAFHYAIMNENQEAIFVLLSKGNCDLSIKNKKNETIFDLARKINNESNKEIYELVMKFDSNYNNTNNNNDNGNTNNNKKEKKLSSNTDNDKVFMFPPKEDISSRIEFPFSFQKNSILNSNENDLNNASNSGNKLNFNFNNMNQLSSLIKMENTPVLYLDISDEAHQNNLIFDGLKNENLNLEKTLEQKQNKLINFKNENETLINELNKLKNELIAKNNEINRLTEQKTHEENKFIYQRQLNQAQIEQKDMAIQSLLINFKSLEKEINEEYNKEAKEKIIDDKISEVSTDIGSKDLANTTEKKEAEIDNIKFKYLEKKFSEEKYTDNEVINLLTTDLYDFYHYNKMIYDSRIQEINKTLNLLKKVLDIEAEIKLYGSYATMTSLIWSEVDLLIIPSMDDLNFSEGSNTYGNLIQRIFHKLKATFMKVIYIDDLNIITPIIKIEIGEQQPLIYNIFVFDNTNFSEIKNLEDNSLIKSIILTNDYSNKYKGKFIPLLLGLKQLLFSANLISNYHTRNNEVNLDNINLNINPAENFNRGISSYALNIMLMSFLDNYNFTTEEIPLGQVFIDFLKINGYLMNENNSKRIIVLDYDNNGQREKIEEIKYANENGIETLTIMDPFNIRNNLTEKMYNISQFVFTFIIAFSVIKDNCECSCHYNEEGNYQGKIHCILNKMFKTVKRFASIKKNK